MKLSIIVPAHNEEDNIAEVIKKIEEVISLDHELVVVNDHSTDATRAIVEDIVHRYSNVRVVDNKDAPGFANAIKAGFKNIQTDVVVLVMADLCDDLNIILEMYNKIDSGYDIVCGARYIKGGARLGGSRLKAFFSFFVSWSLYYLLGLPTHDIANAFKMYRKKVIDKIDIKAKSFEISMEIPLKGYYLGFKMTEVPTVWRERTKGKSNFKMFKLLPNYLRFYIWAILKRITH
jgi:glycosyltransferase involved in cell wall biosynthesis